MDEETVSAWVDGLLEPSEIASLERHVDACPDCERFVAALAQLAESPKVGGSDATRSRVGRYQVIAPLGSGAMSLVYRARDEQLERDVALKLLRVALEHDPGGRGNRRLLAEARAMAQLNHPNVIAVHDIGTFEGEVFIAMELVTGQTLRAWLRQRRSTQKIVSAFVDAGRGIAAAHESGLVHRDVKPDNILVHDDGRVLVTDFGLARASQDEEPHDAEAEPVRFLTLTQTDAVVGTPFYMAPEQRRGHATPRSDQFSFAVSLWEATAGVRPFAGDDLETLSANIEAGKLNGQPRPAWLRRVLKPALSADPDARYARMPDLIDALQAGLRRRRRAAVGSAVALGIGAICAAIALNPGAPKCASFDAELAKVWSPARRTALILAISKDQPSYAAKSAVAIADRIDAIGRAWLAAQTECCEAQQAKLRSASLLRAQSLCLSESLEALDAAVDVLAKGGRRASIKGAKVIDGLDAIDRCDDFARTTRLASLSDVEPGSPKLATYWILNRNIARARALHDIGQYREGLEALGDTAKQAVELGSRDVESRARHVECTLLARLDDMKSAERACHRAAVAASAAGSAAGSARAWSRLIGLLGSKQARYEDADQWAEYAQAALERAGRPPDLVAAFELEMGVVTKQRARYAEAIEHYERAVKLYREAYGENDMRVARSLNNLAIVLGVVNRSSEALKAHEQALSIKKVRLGAEHPSVAISLVNMGLIHRGARDDLARPLFEKALSIAEAALKPGHPTTVAIQINLGMLEHRTGHQKEAVQLLDAALASTQKRYRDRPHPSTAALHENLGIVLRAQGKLQRALELHRMTLEIRTKLYKEDHDGIANAENNIGITLSELGRHREALVHLRRGLSIRRKVLGPEHGDVAYDLGSIGHTLLALGERAEARAVLEQALARYEAKSKDLTLGLGADIRFDLARSLRGDRGRADMLAKKALEVYRDRGPRSKVKAAKTFLEQR